MVAPEDRPTPDSLREGVRSAVASALTRDVERRGGRTGRQLVLSGMIGVGGALAVTWLVAGHPLGHHPSWHLAFYTALWAGLLIVVLSFALLDVRTPRWPVGSAARCAVLALIIAGVCGWICPDQHFLHWWGATQSGAWIERLTGSLPSSVFCFGLVATGVFALLAALPTLPPRTDAGHRWLLTAGLVVLLLAPGIALQSTGAEPWVFACWIGGVTAGALAGVAAAIVLRDRLVGGSRTSRG